MNYEPTIKLVQQTTSDNCVSACLSMVSLISLKQIMYEFHDKYHNQEIKIYDFLRKHKIPATRLKAESDIKPDNIYLMSVPSLNIEGYLHYMVAETIMVDDEVCWWIFDPNQGREGKRSYTNNTLKGYTLEYCIPKNWFVKRVKKVNEMSR